MAITRLDSAAVNTSFNTTQSFTVSSGTDRCLVWAIGGEWTSAGPTAATYGGQTMTNAVNVQSAADPFRTVTQIWYILDSGIAAASNTTLSGTPTTNYSPIKIAASYEGVNQTGGATTVPETNSAAGTPAANPPNIDITEADGNLIVASASCTGLDNYSWDADMTEQFDTDSDNATHSFADRLCTTSNTITPDPTFGSAEDSSNASAEFAAAVTDHWRNFTNGAILKSKIGMM